MNQAKEALQNEQQQKHCHPIFIHHMPVIVIILEMEVHPWSRITSSNSNCSFLVKPKGIYALVK
jgi:hypothetical protein